MPFELLEPIEAKLTSVTNRVERHGDQEVPAISLGFCIASANTLLDKINPTLRHALYKAVEGQDQLPGVEPSTPLLRAKGIDTCNLAGTFEGWTLQIEHGFDEEDPITLGSVKVDRLKVEPMEGGSVKLYMRCGTSDVSPEDAGLLWSKNGQEVSITLTAPKVSAATIDGTVAAFKADHPESSLFDPEAPTPDATDLFVAGADDAGDDDGDDLEP